MYGVVRLVDPIFTFEKSKKVRLYAGGIGYEVDQILSIKQVVPYVDEEYMTRMAYLI